MEGPRDQAKAIFLEAVEHHPPERWGAYLDEACGDDPGLRRRVEVLLEAHREADSLLDGPPPTEPGSGATPLLPAPPAEGPGTVVGPYKLLEVLGEGGMGIVYRAEQARPVRRTVALKVIKPGMDSAQVLARFEAERQALALMDHPGIARVLDAGTTDAGRPYFVMELIRGVPITTYCDEVRLPTRERIALFVQVCRAVQHAHQKGIIHRDLKPSNVLVAMVDGRPTPRVIDFGVAKAIDQRLTEQTLFTQHGALVGTLEYMSPEQAELSALDVDTRADIYSLGVLLYELLTGSTPLERARLREAGYAEILRRIKEEESPKPSTRLSDSGDRIASLAAQRRTEPARLTREVRGELDWVVMKALDKDRTRRYESASGFARDLERHLEGDPVEAGPPSASYRLRKLARKHRVALAVAGLVAVCILGGAAASAWQAYRATRAERLTSEALGREAHSRALAQQRQGEAEAQEREAVSEKRRAESLLARSLLRNGIQRLKDGSALGLFDLIDAHDAAGHDPELQRAASELWSAWSAPVQDRLAAILEGGRAVGFSPDGRWLAVASGDAVQLWATADWRRGPLLSHPPGAEVTGALFSLDGTRLATIQGGVARLWDAATGRLAAEPTPPGAAGLPAPWQPGVVFSPDGRLLAFCASESDVRLWDIQAGRLHGPPLAHPAPVAQVAFSRDGSLLATGTRHPAAVRFWDVGTGRTVIPPILRREWVNAMAFSPDESLLAVPDDYNNIQLWEVPSGRLRDAPFRNLLGGWITTLAFSPDGTRLASGDSQWNARVWDAATGQPVGAALRHGGRLLAVRFSPDGRTLATAALDGLVRLWDVETQEPLGFPFSHPANDPAADITMNTVLEFSPDGRLLAIGYGTTTRVYRVGRGSWSREHQYDAPILAADLSLDGKRLAAVTAATPAVRIREIGTGRQVLYPIASHGDVRPGMVVFSPDGSRLAVREAGRTVRLLDSETGRPIGRPIRSDRNFAHLVFSPDGKRLATSETLPEGRVRLWDSETQELIRTMSEGGATSLAFSPDGRRLAAGNHGWRVNIWDLVDEAKEPQMFRTNGRCYGVAFSPGGDFLATGSDSGIVLVWDLARSEHLWPPIRHADPVSGVRFLPHGHLLATTTTSGPAQLWDLALGSPYQSVTLPQSTGARGASFAGERLLVYRGDTARLYRLPEPPSTTREMQLMAWVALGTRVERGEYRAIPAEEWAALRAELRALRSADETPVDPAPTPDARDHLQAFDLLRRGHRLRQAGQTEAAGAAYRGAADLLRGLITRDPPGLAYRIDLVSALEALGEIDAGRSAWEAASAHFAEALDAGADVAPHRLFYEGALASLGAGRVDEYRAICSRMLARFVRSDDPFEGNGLAWTCALAPGAVADPGRIVALAEAAVAERPEEPAFLNTLGVALYRAGRYAEAVRRLEESANAGGVGGSPIDCAFLAMAHHGLGHAEEAKAWLARAEAGMRRSAEASGSPAQTSTQNWAEHLEEDFLSREADSLLKDAAFPADPFARP